MAQREKGGRVVFIGNIPYGVSEEQICEIFGRVGAVQSFRLVYDKETGRPKGFGFLEYANTDEAASAVRNLNEHEIMGRTLRVDYSNDNGGGSKNDQDKAPATTHFSTGAQPNGTDSSTLPPLPPGIDVPAGLSAPDAISKTLQQIPAPQLLDIISQMKSLVNTEPQKATALLQQAPQLSYAIFQALLLLGLVDTNILASLIQQTGAIPAPPVQPPVPQQPLPMPAYQQPPPPQMPPIYSQQPAPPIQYSAYQYAPTPPVAQQPAYQPPQPPQPAPPAATPDQTALIQQVMSMTRDQVFGLDPEARDQIIKLRASWGAPVL